MPSIPRASRCVCSSICAMSWMPLWRVLPKRRLASHNRHFRVRRQRQPACTLLSADLCRDLDSESIDMVILGVVRPDILPCVLKTLDPARKPVLFVVKEKQSAQSACEMRPGVRILQQQEGWLEVLMLVASEILRLAQAVKRAHRAEQACKSLERQASLARYMLDLRQSLI